MARKVMADLCSVQMEKLNVEGSSSSSSQLEHHVINCRNIGAIDVYVQVHASASRNVNIVSVAAPRIGLPVAAV